MDLRLPALLLVFAASPAIAGTAKPHAISVSNLEALSGQPPSVIVQPVQAMAVIGLQPAPLPNPDIDPPNSAGPAETSLSPALLSSKELFQGDGFSHASNRDHGIDQRTQPAAGLNLSMPVK